MTDLSKRIMDAWLEANPEPIGDGITDCTQWFTRRLKLQAMLQCDAYESAVMQLLLPRKKASDLVDLARKEVGSKFHLHCSFFPENHSYAMEFTEALLNAILAARKT